MSKWMRIVGSLLLLGFLAWRLDWGQLAGAFASFDLRFGLMALSLYLAAQLISSYRWKLLAEPLGFTCSLSRYITLYFIGMFFNLVLPSSVGGDVVRAWNLGQGKSRFTASFLSVVAERGSGVVILVAMACLGGVLLPMERPWWMVVILSCLAGGLMVGVGAIPFLPQLQKIPFIGKRLRQPILAIQLYLRQPRLLIHVMILSIVVQVASVTQVWLLSMGLGLEVSLLYLMVAVPLLTLLTLIPISVNGMGLRELGLLVLLAPVGVSGPSAVTLSLIQFAVCVTASLIGGGFYMAGSYPRITLERQGQRSPKEEQGNVGAISCDPNQGREGQSATAA